MYEEERAVACDTGYRESTWWQKALMVGGHLNTERMKREWGKIPALVIPNTYVEAGAGGVERTNLADALLRSFETDAHLLVYETPEGIRLRKGDHDGVEVAFHVLWYDADAVGHEHVTDPEQFARLLWFMAGAVWQHEGLVTPGPCYETRGGARIGYVLSEPITDREEYEAKWLALGERLAKVLGRYPDGDGIYDMGYRIDLSTSAWSGMQRCRGAWRDKGIEVQVVDGKPQPVMGGWKGWDARMLVLSWARLDPTTLKVKTKPKPKRRAARGGGVDRIRSDPALKAYLKGKGPGDGRNNSLYRVCISLLRRYADKDAAEAVLLEAVDHAVDEGLPEREALSVLASARRAVGRE